MATNAVGSFSFLFIFRPISYIYSAISSNEHPSPNHSLHRDSHGFWVNGQKMVLIPTAPYGAHVFDLIHAFRDIEYHDQDNANTPDHMVQTHLTDISL